MLRHSSMPGMSSWITLRSLHLTMMLPKDPTNLKEATKILQKSKDTKGQHCLPASMSQSETMLIFLPTSDQHTDRRAALEKEKYTLLQKISTS